MNTEVELIGPAKSAFRQLSGKLTRFKSGGGCNDPLLLWGEAGVGKSTVMLKLAREIVQHCTNLEYIIGQELTVDLVRAWRRSACYRPINGWVQVKAVDEIDSGSPPALKELRSYLDTLKPWLIFMATTNKRPSELDASVSSRFYDMEVKGVSRAELTDHVCKMAVPPDMAAQIVAIANGNVRQAQLDARKWIDWQMSQNERNYA